MPGVSSTTAGFDSAMGAIDSAFPSRRLVICGYRPHRKSFENRRKMRFKHLAIFEHIRHSRGDTQIVLEHVIRPSPPRTKSVPVTWHQTRRGGFNPWHCLR